MEHYTPPFSITNEMLELVASISEKVGAIGISSSMQAKPHLRKNNRIRSIHSSLRIEANSLSLEAVSDVIDGRRVAGDPGEILEVKNAYQAYEELHNIDPFSTEDLLRIHGIMTQGLISEAGAYRKGNEGVFSGDRCIFVAPPPDRVPLLMDDLFIWMRKNSGHVHPLVLAAVFHYEFVFIHPFADGNGRMARLWHTLLLYNWREIFEFVPLESQIEYFQSDYYEAIALCHSRGDSNAFIEFILKQIDAVLDEAIGQISEEGFSEDLCAEMQYNPYVARMVEVMEENIPYTSKQIIEMLGLKSKETFRKNYLNPAMDMGCVVMTIPSKPTSRNQRYIRKAR